MTIIQSPTGGEAAIFTWLADKVLGGAKKALGWSWDQGQWAAAQDRYDQQVIRDYGEIRIFGQTDPKSLKDVYTDVYVLDRPTANRRFDPETLAAHLWTEDRGLSFRHGERQAGQTLLNDADKFVILGKPGAGKTTFLKYLAVREAQRGAWGDCLGKIPIFVPLRQLAESAQTLDDLMAFIVDQFAICHFPDAAPFVDKLLREGKALVLFDGLDEVPRLPDPQEDQRGTMALTLERFARQYDQCHIAITSRIAATEYVFGAAFTYLEIADFAPEQVDAFVRNWFWDKKKPDQSSKTAAQMLEELEQPEHQGIRDLTRNPLLLTLLCLSYAETMSFPARRVEIYQEAIQALLKKWDSSRQIRRGSLYKTLSLGRKEQMFARIAWDGFVAGSALFSQDDLASRLVAYLQHVPEMPAAVDIDGEIVLREIVAQHGIFTEQAYHLFSFAHLTFQEYYAARYAVDNAAEGTLAVLASRLIDPKWREVLLLTASLLPDASQFLSHFLASLDKRAISRPRLASWLSWIDEQARVTQIEDIRMPTEQLYARYHQFTRDFDITSSVVGRIHAFEVAFLSHKDHPLAGAMARIIDFTRGIIRTLVQVRTFDAVLLRALGGDRDPSRENAIARSLVLSNDLVLAINYAINEAFALAVVLSRGLDLSIDVKLLSQAQALPARWWDHTALQLSMADIELPRAAAGPEAWSVVALEIRSIVMGQPEVQHYQSLQTGTDMPSERQGSWWMLLDADNLNVFIAYLEGTILFYDCLQLAYVPYRRRFEDRIFSPPT